MPTVVDVQGLHKQYGPTVAVDDVSLQVQEGEIFGILGPNGAGKTTTVECIEGLRTADQARRQRPRGGRGPGLQPRPAHPGPPRLARPGTAPC